jgi:hypothetical protein
MSLIFLWRLTLGKGLFPLHAVVASLLHYTIRQQAGVITLWKVGLCLTPAPQVSECCICSYAVNRASMRQRQHHIPRGLYGYITRICLWMTYASGCGIQANVRIHTVKCLPGHPISFACVSRPFNYLPKQTSSLPLESNFLFPLSPTNHFVQNTRSSDFLVHSTSALVPTKKAYCSTFTYWRELRSFPPTFYVTNSPLLLHLPNRRLWSWRHPLLLSLAWKNSTLVSVFLLAGRLVPTTISESPWLFSSPIIHRDFAIRKFKSSALPIHPSCCHLTACRLTRYLQPQTSPQSPWRNQPPHKCACLSHQGQAGNGASRLISWKSPNPVWAFTGTCPPKRRACSPARRPSDAWTASPPIPVAGLPGATV